MKHTYVAQNYGQALFYVAQKGKALDAVEADFRALTDAFDNSLIDEIWDNPKVAKPEKHKLADTVLKGANPYLKNLVHMAIDRNRITYLASIFEEFLKVRDAESDTLHVVVEAAYELSKATQDKLAKRLHDLSEHPVRLSVVENPDIIGGIRIKFKDNMVDGSVQARLEGMRHQLMDLSN
jgi:F-type H+-transporting ATPase subunit delta